MPGRGRGHRLPVHASHIRVGLRDGRSETPRGPFRLAGYPIDPADSGSRRWPRGPGKATSDSRCRDADIPVFFPRKGRWSMSRQSRSPKMALSFSGATEAVRAAPKTIEPRFHGGSDGASAFCHSRRLAIRLARRSRVKRRLSLHLETYLEPTQGRQGQQVHEGPHSRSARAGGERSVRSRTSARGGLPAGGVTPTSGCWSSRGSLVTPRRRGRRCACA